MRSHHKAEDFLNTMRNIRRMLDIRNEIAEHEFNDTVRHSVTERRQSLSLNSLSKTYEPPTSTELQSFSLDHSTNNTSKHRPSLKRNRLAFSEDHIQYSAKMTQDNAGMRRSTIQFNEKNDILDANHRTKFSLASTKLIGSGPVTLESMAESLESLHERINGITLVLERLTETVDKIASTQGNEVKRSSK